MGTIRVGINGFGRIGRMVFRAIFNDSRFHVVLINDLLPYETVAYLLKRDSVHGAFDQDVRVSDRFLHVGDKKIQLFSEKDPKSLPHRELHVDVVVESTGRFLTREQCLGHIVAGAPKVILTAPSSDIPMYVMGVNQNTYHPDEKIISNASCTTNCLAPIAKVVHENFGIVEGLMTTVHAVTAKQPSVDCAVPGDLRGSRSVLGNIIPSSTGAAKAATKVMPELNEKLTGMAFRVPVVDVSVVDLTVRIEKSASMEDIAAAMKEASENQLKGILGYSEEPLVSTDLIGCPLSAVFDRGAGIQLNTHFHKLIAWYDNEWGYANRVADMMLHMTAGQVGV